MLHLSLIVAPDADFAICVGVIILQVLHLALPHGHVSPSVYPFGVRFMCIAYIAYMGTVVLIVKISLKRFAHCVDSEDKLYTFCTLCLRVLFTFHIYLNTISYQVAADQITWARKGHNLLFVNFTFLCYF